MQFHYLFFCFVGISSHRSSANPQRVRCGGPVFCLIDVASGEKEIIAKVTTDDHFTVIGMVVFCQEGVFAISEAGSKSTLEFSSLFN